MSEKSEIQKLMATSEFKAADVVGLRGSTMDRELKKCNFVCPKNSEEKAGRSCVDSFNDCECDLGYFKTNGKCGADTRLCTEDSIEMIKRKQAEVYSWLDKAKDMNSYNEKVECIDNLNKVLYDVWLDYNAVKASCDKIDDDGGWRLAFGDFFRGVRDFFVDVGDKVADFVVDIVNDAKCVLVGTAFKIFGRSLDIFLTVVTGGTNKLSKAACVAGEAVSGGRLLAQTAIGLSSTICSLNKKTKSDVLGEVCNFTGDIEAQNVSACCLWTAWKGPWNYSGRCGGL